MGLSRLGFPPLGDSDMVPIPCRRRAVWGASGTDAPPIRAFLRNAAYVRAFFLITAT